MVVVALSRRRQAGRGKVDEEAVVVGGGLPRDVLGRCRGEVSGASAVNYGLEGGRQ